MKLKKRINIELLTKTSNRHIPVIQNDRGRIIECYITDCQIPTGTKVKFWAMKPSKKLVYNDCTLKDNVVSIELTNQTLAEKGSVACQLEFDGDVSSYEFFLDVERDISGNGVVSENESTVLDALLEEMRVAVANVKIETEKTKAATAEAKKATEEAIKATQESVNPIKEVKGSDITADQTHQGAAIIKELQGGTRQATTQGRNLFDASKLPTKSDGGATVTNNGDGSFTISGSGNLTKNFNNTYSYSGLPSFIDDEPGSYTISGIESAYPSCELTIIKVETGSTVVGISKNVKTMSLTKEVIDAIKNGMYRVFLYVYGTSGRPITPGTIKPMVNKGLEPLPWEPFTGGAPSPNPDYQQEIKAIGDNGWFSGEITTGGYNFADGSYADNRAPSGTMYYYTDKHKEYIPCKANDVIEVAIEKTKAFNVFFYREDKTYITYKSVTGSVIVPEGASYFRFDIRKETTVYPDYKALGKVIVLVNGKYVTKIEIRGKNLIQIDGNPASTGKYKVIDKKENTIQSAIDNFYYSTIIITNKNIADLLFKNRGKRLNFRCDLVKGNNKTIEIVIYGNRTTGVPYQISKAEQKTSLIISEDFEKINSLEFRFNRKFEPFTDNTSVYTNLMAWIGDDEPQFQPYKSSIIYIPLDSPLYEGDRIYLEDGELWEYRENARVIYDGSIDERWNVQQYSNLCAYVAIKDSIYGKVFCNRFRQYDAISSRPDGTAGIAIEGVTTNISGFFFGIKGIATDTTTWKSYLEQNPVEVVYKLKTPTLKKLGSAEAFNIRTFDDRTYIEVVGSKELGTENTFIVPRNQSGGLITDAFATSKRNEINAAGQANLASRIQALEQLAVKM